MKQGFTLLELMVTVIIIGILAATAMPQYTKAVNKARLAEAISNMGSIQKGIDMYCIQFREECNTETTLFLPPDVGVKLDIDLSGTLSGGVGAYGSKYFLYSAGCGPGSCVIEIAGRANTNLPTLYATRTPSGLYATWTKSCSGGDAALCKSLVNQGYTVE